MCNCIYSELFIAQHARMHACNEIETTIITMLYLWRNSHNEQSEFRPNQKPRSETQNRRRSNILFVYILTISYHVFKLNCLASHFQLLGRDNDFHRSSTQYWGNSTTMHEPNIEIRFSYAVFGPISSALI